MDCFNSEWGSVQAEVACRVFLSTTLVGKSAWESGPGCRPWEGALWPRLRSSGPGSFLITAQRHVLGVVHRSSSLSEPKEPGPRKERKPLTPYLFTVRVGRREVTHRVFSQPRTGCSPSRISPGSSPLRDSRWLNVYVSVECLCIFVHLFISFIIVVLPIFWICNSS